jgi:hypothetical protein
MFRNTLLLAFGFCCGAAAVDVLLHRQPVLKDACDLSDEYEKDLEEEIRECPTEMCVVYFIDKADVAKEECLGTSKIDALPSRVERY